MNFASNARARLECILNVIGNDVIYCDTDSIKFIGNHDRDFDAINKIQKEIKNELCEQIQ